jgi:hypothetical protein
MNNTIRRIVFWFVFTFFVAVVGKVGYYHLPGTGCFRPVLVTETQVIDLGVVPPDSLTECEFFVTNGGMGSLKIENVRSGCAGCIEIISFPTEPIRSGESVSIRIALDVRTLKGKTRKSLIIISNDPVRPVYPILIDAVVEVKDNHKFTNVGRFATPMRRLGNDTKEAYRQKAWERNHRRTGIYGQMEGETRTSNPDVDGDGNLIEGVELDFDSVEDGLHPHAYLRLFVDDTESWYRYDRLPGVSSLDEEPMGVWWNLPDVENHRTTLWSENGCLHIEHVTPEEEDAT